MLHQPKSWTRRPRTRPASLTLWTICLAPLALGALDSALEAQEPSQAHIVALWQNAEPVDVSHPGEVCLLQDLDLSSHDTVKVGDTLAAGDLIARGPCPILWQRPTDETYEDSTLLVGISCGDGTEMTFSGPFHVMMFDPEGEDCAIDLAQGTVDVLTDQPATVHSGGVSIGVEGTQFSVVRGFDKETAEAGRIACRLYEGSVHIVASADTPQLTRTILRDGQEWRKSGGRIEQRMLPQSPILEAAERMARVDVARAWSQGGLRSSPGDCVACQVVEDLVPDYVRVLGNGSDPDLRRQLAQALEARGLSISAERERQRIRSHEIQRDQATDEPLPQLQTPQSPCPSVPESGIVDCPARSSFEQQTASQKILLPLTTGIVILEMPSPLRRGEQISGTMTVSGAGSSRQAKQGQRQLSKYHVMFGDTKLPVQDGPWYLSLPSDGDTLPITLRKPRGKVLLNKSVNLLPPTEAPFTSTFEVPGFCRADEPLTLNGPFDGDHRNTRLTHGGQPLPLLAETAGRLVVACPEQAGGGQALVLDEGDQHIEFPPLRSIELHFEVAEKDLDPGDRTQATIQLRGLQGFDRPLGLQVRNKSPAIVRMEGGEERFIEVWPAAWGDGDTFTQTFDLLVHGHGVATLRVELVPLP